MSILDFDQGDITSIIRNLNPNKAHGHDGISIRMVQLSCASIVKPLYLIFRHCIETSTFPLEWKKANVVPIHKKGDKCNISNYHPISVLPICGKLFEKLIYHDLHKYLSINNILNSNQSGFRTGDSCANQIIEITHEILKSFDSNPTLEIRGVFLDISKAFDKVWHDGLVFKLKTKWHR